MAGTPPTAETLPALPRGGTGAALAFEGFDPYGVGRGLLVLKLLLLLLLLEIYRRSACRSTPTRTEAAHA